YPMFTLRWNQGVDNYMLYATGNLTVGRYHQQSLANLGIGHNAIDAGGSYTYLDQKSGMEFSATLGFTYNFENTHTQYQNGVDMHLDMGASKFVTKQLQLGVVAYGYQQVSCDSGAGDRVGCFESRVFGAGPQVGYIIPIDEHLQGYLNLKAYKEFGEQHRPAGWNTWVTFVISPAAPEEKSKMTTPMMRKYRSGTPPPETARILYRKRPPRLLRPTGLSLWDRHNASASAAARAPASRRIAPRFQTAWPPRVGSGSA